MTGQTRTYAWHLILTNSFPATNQLQHITTLSLNNNEKHRTTSYQRALRAVSQGKHTMHINASRMYIECMHINVTVERHFC